MRQLVAASRGRRHGRARLDPLNRDGGEAAEVFGDRRGDDVVAGGHDQRPAARVGQRVERLLQSGAVVRRAVADRAEVAHQVEGGRSVRGAGRRGARAARRTRRRPRAVGQREGERDGGECRKDVRATTGAQGEYSHESRSPARPAHSGGARRDDKSSQNFPEWLRARVRKGLGPS